MIPTQYREKNMTPGPGVLLLYFKLVATPEGLLFSGTRFELETSN